MKIVAWNCHGNFKNKIKEIKEFGADIYVISECENPCISDSDEYKDFASNHHWVGQDNYGLGIFATNKDITFELVDLDSEGLRYFLPVRVNDDFNLLGVWTNPNMEGSKVVQYPKEITEYYEAHKNSDTEFFNEGMIICGDFNCDKRLYEKKHGKNVDEMISKLFEINLIDIYHEEYGEQEGKESAVTHYWHWDENSPYHLDHVFAAKGKVKCLHVDDDYDKWVKSRISDHVPIIFKI